MKTIVITGSTRGIGLCMAKEFLRNGCNVILSGRKQQSDHLKEELSKFNKNNYDYIACDVSNVSEIENLWKKSVQKFGQIDVWINNAGQNSPYEFSYDIEATDVKRLMATNINGMIYGSQIAAKHMLQQGFGHIWNMEGLGSNGMIQKKTILYGTSKCALTYFTKGLAKELDGSNVNVGRLSPGMMLTDFITKTPDGDRSPVLEDKSFKFIFNTLGDLPDTVAAFFIPRILQNKKNNAHIVYLTNAKIMRRFISSPFIKRKLIE